MASPRRRRGSKEVALTPLSDLGGKSRSGAASFASKKLIEEPRRVVAQLVGCTDTGAINTPQYLTSDTAATMWDALPVAEDAARAEGQHYKEVYFKDVQFVFSRVQHHMHKRTKKGYVPLHNCAKKTKGKAAEMRLPGDTSFA